MAEDEEHEHAELATYQCRAGYVYAPIPPASTIGHRAEVWNVEKWLQEVWVAVVTRGDDCFIRLTDPASGELFAECPVPNDRPLTTAVEPVVDSSRYFVLRVVDRQSKQHAFIGLGFGDRQHASDFNAALHEHLAIVRRAREAAARRAAYEAQGLPGQAADDGAGPSSGAAPSADWSLKPGTKITLKLNNPKLRGSPAGSAPAARLPLAAAPIAVTTSSDGSQPMAMLTPPPRTAGLMRVSADAPAVSPASSASATTAAAAAPGSAREPATRAAASAVDAAGAGDTSQGAAASQAALAEPRVAATLQSAAAEDASNASDDFGDFVG